MTFNYLYTLYLNNHKVNLLFSLNTSLEIT